MRHGARTRKLLEELQVVADLRRRGEYLQAVKRADALLERCPGVTRALVLKAMAFQQIKTVEEVDSLGRKAVGEAKRALNLAVKLDPSSADALNELGFYLWAFENNSPSALKAFEKSAELSLDLLCEAYVGWIKALRDLGRRRQAATARSTAEKRLQGTRRLRNLRRALHGDD